MPWRETSPMDQRVGFINDYLRSHWSMTELCARYGVSRKTGYKWIDRFKAEGFHGLADRSRRPHHSPRATRSDVVEALIAAKRRHTDRGAKKLLPPLARERPDWPHRSDWSSRPQRPQRSSWSDRSDWSSWPQRPEWSVRPVWSHGRYRPGWCRRFHDRRRGRRHSNKSSV